MTSNRIIGVCIDGSDSANNAFQWALDHLYREDDDIVLIHVYEKNDSATQRERIDELTQSKVEALEKSGKKGKVVSKELRGGIGEDIVKIVKEEGIQMVVTGTRGLNTVKRVLLGSVSDYLVKHPHCTVITFRDNR